MGEQEETEPDLGPQHIQLTPLRDHRYSERFAVERVTVSADGSELAAITRASREGARSWEFGSGRSMKLPPMSRDAAAMAWSPAKDLLAVTVMADVLSGEQAGIELLSMADGSSQGFLIGGETSKTLAFSPDGSHLAAATSEGVVIYGLPGGKGWLAAPSGSGAQAVSWLSPSQLMVASDEGSRLERIDLDGKVLESWQGDRTDGGLCFSPTGQFLAAGHEGEFHVIDLWNGGAAQRVLLKGAVTSLAWSMNGKVIVAGVDIGLVYSFSAEGASGVAFSQDVATSRRRPVGAQEDRSREDRGREDRSREDRSRSARDDRAPADRAREDRGRSARDDGLVTLRGDDRSNNDRNPPGQGTPSESATDLEPSLRVLVLDSMGSEVRDGGKMERSLTKSIKRIEPCWKRQARAGKLGRGKLVLELGVNANGEGVAMQTPAEDTFENEKLLSCLHERLREPLFGSGLGSMDIELTIELK